MTNPVILDVKSDYIVLGFYFDYFNKESPRTVLYNGMTYYREGLEAIRHEDAGKYCSCRKYTVKPCDCYIRQNGSSSNE